MLAYLRLGGVQLEVDDLPLKRYNEIHRMNQQPNDDPFVRVFKNRFHGVFKVGQLNKTAISDPLEE
jgi:hypothetical protein